jgi:hypothetical protein
MQGEHRGFLKGVRLLSPLLSRDKSEFAGNFCMPASTSPCIFSLRAERLALPVGTWSSGEIRTAFTGGMARSNGFSPNDRGREELLLVGMEDY